MISSRIGPGTGAVFTAIRDQILFPQSKLAGLVNPLAARLGPDLVLPGAVATNDLVLLDQDLVARATWIGGQRVDSPDARSAKSDSLD